MKLFQANFHWASCSSAIFYAAIVHAKINYMVAGSGWCITISPVLLIRVLLPFTRVMILISYTLSQSLSLVVADCSVPGIQLDFLE